MNGSGMAHSFKSDDLAEMFYNLTGRINAEIHDLEDGIAEARTSIERDLITVELRGVMTGLAVIRAAFGCVA